MPVRHEDLPGDTELPGRFDIYDYMESIEEMIATTSQLPCEDVWKKFDLLDTNNTNIIDDQFETETVPSDEDVVDVEISTVLSTSPETASVKKQQFFSCCGGQYDREIRHHDCMWGGFCLSNDHGTKYPNRNSDECPAANTSSEVRQILKFKTELGLDLIKSPAITIKEEPSKSLTEERRKQLPTVVKIKTEPVYDNQSSKPFSIKSEPSVDDCESVSLSTTSGSPNTKVVSITTKSSSSNIVNSHSNVFAEESTLRRRYIVQRTAISRSPNSSSAKSTFNESPLLSSTVTSSSVTLPISVVKRESVKASSPCVVKINSPASKRSWNSNLNGGVIPVSMIERPETPPSLPESDDESAPIAINNAGQALFKSAIDTIIGTDSNISAKLPNYDSWDSEDSAAALASWPVSEVTGQVRRTAVAKMIMDSVSVTDSDHNYGIKMENSKYLSPIKMDDLGVQTPSDSEEEEVDVVSFQDHCSDRSSSRSSSVSREFEAPMPSDDDDDDDDDDDGDDDDYDREEKEEKATYCTKSQRYVKKKRRESFSYDDDYIQEELKSSRVSQPRKRIRLSKSKSASSNPSSKNSSPAKSRFGSTDDSESENVSTDRRSFHNSMERKRRVDLRNSFEELRMLVPRIEHKKRSPKVVILNEAALFCMELSTSSQKMSAELSAMRRQQEHLRSAVSMLRKSLAANR